MALALVVFAIVLVSTPGTALAQRGQDLTSYGFSPDPLAGMAAEVGSAPHADLEKDADLEKIVNGVGTQDFPTTAALLYADGAVATKENARGICTATLIGCRTVLTAAHCVEGDATPSHYMIYLQNAGHLAVRSIASHPEYAFPRADVAVIELQQPVMGIAPTPINSQADPSQHLGSTAQIAGFGQTSSSGGYGVKRAGEVTLTSCSGDASDLNDRQNVCWRFESPLGAAGEDSNTCNGDSGGPLFANFGFGTVVAGVTSGGSDGDCGASGGSDFSFDANVYTYRSFIEGRMGGDSTAVCGGVPAVGSSGTGVAHTSGSLGSGQQLVVRYDVGAGAGTLVFAANGVDDSLDLDLFVQQGDTVSPSNAACAVNGSGTFASCTVDASSGGTWSALVRAQSGSGAYQLTTTSFDATLSVISEDGGGGGGSGGGGGDGGGGGGTGGPSCAGTCGDSPDGSCWCDAACVDYGDCCADYQDQCTGGGGGGGGGGGPSGPSCSASCGDTPDGSCWCDASCVEYGDCCADYQDQCTGGGGGGGGGSGGGDGGGTGGGDSCVDLVCDDDPYCCEVEWDDLCEDAADWLC